MQAREQPWRATFAAPAPGPASQVTGTSQLIPPTSAADCLKAWADWFTSTWDRVAKQSGPYRVFNGFEWNGPGIGSSPIHRGKLNRAKQRVSVTNYYQKPSSQYRRTLFHSGNEFGSFCYKQPYWQAPSHALLPNRSTCRKFCIRDQVDPWSLC